MKPYKTKIKKMRPFREDRPHLRSEGLRRCKAYERAGVQGKKKKKL